MLLKKYKKNDLSDINKIGVIISGLLGDILLRTPVLRALKDIYPNSKIVAITDPIGKSVLVNNNYVDDIIIIDRKKVNKFKKNINKINGILSIRAEKLDLLVNLYNGGSSHLMVALSGAKYKLGFCQNRKEYIYNIENKCAKDRLKDEQTLNNYMISIVEPLSEKQYSLKPVFDLQNIIKKETNKYLSDFNYDVNKIYTLNLASSKEDKILEYKKYLYIVEYIYEKYGFLPAVISNPGQEYIQDDFINKYLQNTSIPFITLKAMSIEEVAAIINITKFIVTPDTGLMHLAMAFENYIYTIFTYTHPIFVDPNNEKFISVYEHFDKEKLYQHQSISDKTIEKKIDSMFSKL
ncbi:MAG: glycosyltransferase family 9 protein [Sulfurimonas sp.]|nr:glycosyltransferase family 9 protein [Sulfurimonas sp.]